MKTIIITWIQEVLNSNSTRNMGFWGLGDLIRGVIKMFQLSKKMNFELIIDIQHHPISNFLKKQSHNYESLILENKNNIPFIYPGKVEEYILANKNKDVLIFLTNDTFNEPITEECKDFIKNLLTMNDEFNLYFQEKKKEIPFNIYNIFHFRLGDSELIEKKYKEKYDIEFSILNNYGIPLKEYNKKENCIVSIDKYEKNIILMSDSFQFKNYVKEKYDIFMFDNNISHIGYDANLETIRETLFEFFVITQSQTIKSYSVYHWTSGFIKVANDIYDVKII